VASIRRRRDRSHIDHHLDRGQDVLLLSVSICHVLLMRSAVWAISIEVQALQFGSKDVGATDAFFPCPGPRPRGIFFNIPRAPSASPNSISASRRRCTIRPGPPNTPCRCLGFVRKRRCCPCSRCPVWTHRAHAHCSAPPGGCRGQAHFLALPDGRWAEGRRASVGGVRPEPPKFRGPRCPGCPYLFRDRSHLPSG
jgi:hypothetical protein